MRRTCPSIEAKCAKTEHQNTSSILLLKYTAHTTPYHTWSNCKKNTCLPIWYRASKRLIFLWWYDGEKTFLNCLACLLHLMLGKTGSAVPVTMEPIYRFIFRVHALIVHTPLMLGKTGSTASVTMEPICRVNFHVYTLIVTHPYCNLYTSLGFPFNKVSTLRCSCNWEWWHGNPCSRTLD